jgi:rhomboid protease GluP
MTGRFAAQQGDWLTVLTAIYLHGSLIHIFFNVMWIRQLGTFAEDELGPARFFVVFSLAGAGGFLLSIFAHTAASVGASGSIFGMLGCVIAFRRRRGAGSDMVSQQFIMWAVALFVLGLVFPGVDNWAHAGGFAVGYVLGRRMHGIRERGEGRNMQLLALALLGLTVAGFIFSIVRRLPEFLAR